MSEKGWIDILWSLIPNMPDGKDWVDLLAALLTIAIAAAALGLGISNHRLARRRREDELFDRRYEFYKKVERMWRHTASRTDPNKQPWLDWDDIEPLAHEAEFLFGDDIAEHLRSLEGDVYDNAPWVPDPAFSEPFRKYLKLGKSCQGRFSG